MRGLILIRALMPIALLASVPITSCSSSGSASPGGGCSRAVSKLGDCGFTRTVSDPNLDCEEPEDAEARCLFDCLLGASCATLVDLYCRGNLALLQTCSTQCEPPPYHCANGEIADDDARCDGFPDCTDGSDEAGCPTFACADGSTAPLDAHCDGYPHCADESDEAGCPAPQVFDCGDGSSVPQSFVCDGEPDCANGSDEAASCPPETDPIEEDCAAMGIAPPP